MLIKGPMLGSYPITYSLGVDICWILSPPPILPPIHPFSTQAFPCSFLLTPFLPPPAHNAGLPALPPVADSGCRSPKSLSFVEWPLTVYLTCHHMAKVAPLFYCCRIGLKVGITTGFHLFHDTSPLITGKVPPVRSWLAGWWKSGLSNCLLCPKMWGRSGWDHRLWNQSQSKWNLGCLLLQNQR